MSEGGVRAFLIADVRGYTAFTQERGDDEAARLAARFAEHARECVTATGGQVLELRGDEALCVFDSPRQALRTAIELQRRFADATREDPSLPLFVGIGLDAGEAVSLEGGFRGGSVNLAARLCALAGPGEVLASDGIVLMAGRVEGLAYSDRGRVRVKGIRNPVRVHRLEFPLDLPPRQPTAPSGIRRPSPRLTAAGAAIAVAAVATAVVLVLRLGDGGPVAVAGDSAALLDPASGRVLQQFPVGATPVAVVSDHSAAWTLDADARTISRVDPDGGRPLTKAAGITPTALALGGGLLWVAFVERERGGTKTGVAGLDPGTLTTRMQATLPRIGPTSRVTPAIAYARGAVWVSGPFDLLRRIDPGSGEVTGSMRLGGEVIGLAPGMGSLWATIGGGTVARIDPARLRQTQRIRLSTPDVGALTVGAGSVWVVDSLAGLVWRIDPGPPAHARTIDVGLGASGLAFGRGVVWVASAVDGRVARIDASSEKVESFPIDNAPQAVSVSPAGIWSAVAAAGGRSIEPAPKLLGLETLATGTCRDPVYGGSGRPDALIVSDLPMQVVDAPVTLAMVQAIEFVLRKHAFRAGRYRIAYQACDDAIVSTGTFDGDKCSANAKIYAAATTVVGVIGPFNSGCAAEQIPTANRIRPGPLAIVAPTASYVGLTRNGPGALPGDPEVFYPTGIRNFARAYPTDDAQGAADAILAKRLRVRHAYVFDVDPEEQYGTSLAVGFSKAARRLGIRVEGPHTPAAGRDHFRSLAASLRSAGIDGVFIAGLNEGGAPAFIRALRKELGPGLVILAPDAFLPASDLPKAIGPAAIGMYVSGAVVTDPLHQLPLTGRRFSREFSATQRGRNVNTYAPYAAQAAEVLLSAIAHSDGTRASITRQLLRVRVRKGIVGSFAIDRNGDSTTNLLPIFRATRRPPKALYWEDRVSTVIPVPVRLLR